MRKSIALAVLVASLVSASPGQADNNIWRKMPNNVPAGDWQCAAHVVHRPEINSDNTPYNDYVPTDDELRAFRAANASSTNPLKKYVTGRSHLPAGASTDDLIQWGSCKWGIPTDWLRAQYAVESNWHQMWKPWYGLGDLVCKMSPETQAQYPEVSRTTCGDGSLGAYTSLGITQVKWAPDGSIGRGTEPLRWKSTTFNIDYEAETVRWFYNGLCNWCGSGYSAGQQWESIGAWFNPAPWNNSGMRSYIQKVQQNLASRSWESY